MTDVDTIVTVITSVGTEQQAVEIGEELVERRLATCVNIVPSRRSIYRWKGGRVCDEAEYLLLIKTPEPLGSSVSDAIMELHSYELPEVMTVADEQVEEVTRRWVADMVRLPEKESENNE